MQFELITKLESLSISLPLTNFTHAIYHNLHMQIKLNDRISGYSFTIGMIEEKREAIKAITPHTVHVHQHK